MGLLDLEASSISGGLKVGQNELDELRDKLACRVNYYNILRHLYFLGPKPRIMDALIKLARCVDLKYASGNLARGAELLRKAEALTEESAALDAIQAEFARVFLGPGTPPAPLYESCYRSPEALLMQEVAIAKRKHYFDAGLVPAGPNHIPEDHLAVELEYLYFLAGEAEQFWAAGEHKMVMEALRESRRFLQQCLEWLPKLIDSALANTEEPAISGMALLTLGLLGEDMQFLIDFCEED